MKGGFFREMLFGPDAVTCWPGLGNMQQPAKKKVARKADIGFAKRPVICLDLIKPLQKRWPGAIIPPVAHLFHSFSLLTECLGEIGQAAIFCCECHGKL